MIGVGEAINLANELNLDLKNCSMSPLLQVHLVGLLITTFQFQE